MNQTQATERIADALNASEVFGFDHVAILTPVPDADLSAILVRCSDGSHLSVTVEVLTP
jgi:hypothetical protein